MSAASSATPSGLSTGRATRPASQMSRCGDGSRLSSMTALRTMDAIAHVPAEIKATRTAGRDTAALVLMHLTPLRLRGLVLETPRPRGSCGPSPMRVRLARRGRRAILDRRYRRPNVGRPSSLFRSCLVRGARLTFVRESIGSRMIFEIVDLAFAFVGTAAAILLRRLVRVTAVAARSTFASVSRSNGR